MCAQEHVAARRLDFLPYHFLLTSVGEAGVLRYQVRWQPRDQVVWGVAACLLARIARAWRKPCTWIRWQARGQ